MIEHCPVCSGDEAEPVLDLGRVPTLPNARIGERRAAAAAPLGAVDLVVCPRCAHQYNQAFSESLLEYDATYDNSLHFSPTFVAYATGLIERLRDEFSLAGSTIAEIGCGSADFLSMLCDETDSTGFGFDPSLDPGRLHARTSPRVTLSARSYPEDGSLRPDLLVSQHVLEHLLDPVGVLRGTVPTLARGGGCYHEVPNTEQIMRDLAVWDLIYEHVSYFVGPSLLRAASAAGLVPRSMGTGFADQYLWITAVGAEDRSDTHAVIDAGEVDRLVAAARRFGEASREVISRCADQLDRASRRGPVALWGAGSKGVSYLNLVPGTDSIVGVVDVNPRKSGTFVPGTGHPIGGPPEARGWAPATVLVGNPIYLDEISAQVAEIAPLAHTELLASWTSS